MTDSAEGIPVWNRLGECQTPHQAKQGVENVLLGFATRRGQAYFLPLMLRTCHLLSMTS
ncbi:hypothetical protein [Psychrobacter pygoscelis]|uniref:hypothetical protein n=1 Tax=Psychrobacter pygoscelis TaxID=2488563 RepID=UPI0013F3ECFF|nr:hypothetical protein [Psychrobacter pygoscelis]